MTDDGRRARPSAPHAAQARSGAARTPTDAEVLRFLAGRPDFLSRHPSLYLTLAPPARVHGDRLADHMAALLAAARQQSARLAIDVGRRRADVSFGARVEAALLGAVRSADPVRWMSEELAATLGLDSAAICLEAGTPPARRLARRDVPRLLAGDAIRFRHDPSDLAALHGEAASLIRHDVLVRLQPSGGRAGLLALGSRDDRLPGPGTERALALLGQGVEAALDRA